MIYLTKEIKLILVIIFFIIKMKKFILLDIGLKLFITLLIYIVISIVLRNFIFSYIVTNIILILIINTQISSVSEYSKTNVAKLNRYLLIFFFSLLFLAPILGTILTLLLSSMGVGGIANTLLVLGLVLISMLIFNFIIIKSSSSLLVSTILNKKVTFKDYYKHFLYYLFLFPVGLIFLDKDIKRLIG